MTLRHKASFRLEFLTRERRPTGPSALRARRRASPREVRPPERCPPGPAEAARPSDRRCSPSAGAPAGHGRCSRRNSGGQINATPFVRGLPLAAASFCGARGWSASPTSAKMPLKAVAMISPERSSSTAPRRALASLNCTMLCRACDEFPAVRRSTRATASGLCRIRGRTYVVEGNDRMSRRDDKEDS